MPGGVRLPGGGEHINLLPSLAAGRSLLQKPLAAEGGDDVVPRLARQQILLAHLLLRAVAAIADGIKHQHPVIAHPGPFGPLRIDPAALDDGVVDAAVLLSAFAFHKKPPIYNPIWDFRWEVPLC